MLHVYVALQRFLAAAVFRSAGAFHLEDLLLFLCLGILLTEQLAVNDAILVTSLQEPLASATDKASVVIHILTCA